MKLKASAIILLLVLVSSNLVLSNEIIGNDLTAPTIEININPLSTIYEGDIINCTITGDPTIKYWRINNESPHFSFYENNPVIYDPEPTPLNSEYVNLTVYAENDVGNSSDTIKLKIKRIFFGDIHWHTELSDGDYPIDKMYRNAIKDNYLDFVCCTEHSEWIDGLRKSYLENLWKKPTDIIKNIWYCRLIIQNSIYYLKNGYDNWEVIKQKANEYYDEGNFSTFIGFEWSGHDEQNFHTNFYYKDVYPDANEYSSSDVLKDKNCKPTLEDVYQAMADEHDKGHLNIAFPHHPLFIDVNWTHLANDINKTNRYRILRGVEVYSTWGNSLGHKYTPDLLFPWPSFSPEDVLDKNDSYVENALWDFSKDENKYQKFAFIAGSDIHKFDRPGSARNETGYFKNPYYPAGIIAAYSVHNNRSEIWDAMDTCDMYGTQLLKIRANVRFDGQMALGRWINCSSPLNITITAMSTFPGEDNSGKSMCPHLYSEDELDYPIQDIWLIKKDNDNGKPWCKIINHSSPNTNIAVAMFKDHDVKPNDFYWVAIRQKGDYLLPETIASLLKIFPKLHERLLINLDNRDDFMAYIGPVFIDNVTNVEI